MFTWPICVPVIFLFLSVKCEELAAVKKGGWQSSHIHTRAETVDWPLPVVWEGVWGERGPDKHRGGRTAGPYLHSKGVGGWVGTEFFRVCERTEKGVPEEHMPFACKHWGPQPSKGGVVEPHAHPPFPALLLATRCIAHTAWAVQSGWNWECKDSRIQRFKCHI